MPAWRAKPVHTPRPFADRAEAAALLARRLQDSGVVLVGAILNDD